MINDVVWSIFDYILSLVEVILLCMLLGQVLKRKERVPNYLFVFGIVGLVSLVFLAGAITSHSLIKICISYFAYVLFAIIFYEGLFKARIMFCTSYFMCIGIIDLTTFVGMSFITNTNINDVIMYNGWFKFIVTIIGKLFLFIAIKAIAKLTHKELQEMPRKFWYMLLGVFIISIVSMIGVAEIGVYFQNNDIVGFILIVISLGVFASTTIIYFAFQQICEYFNKEKEYQMIEYQNKLLVKTALETDEYQKEVRKMHHDFNNHISCIDMLLQMENIAKARQYMKDMQIFTENNYRQIKLGNDIADAVVNQKYSVAQNNQIDFKVEGSLREEIGISAVDLCALMSNALDNAIEANLKIKDVSKRKIHLNIKPYKDYLFVDVTNAVEELVDIKNLKTTKKDKSKHGIGMLSMQKVVEKHEGYLKYKYENNSFNLSIMVKIVK